MALQSSGAISLADIQTEFGGSNPISLSEYYKGGGLTTNYGSNPVATSGEISANSFYSTKKNPCASGYTVDYGNNRCTKSVPGTDMVSKVGSSSSDGVRVDTTYTTGAGNINYSATMRSHSPGSILRIYVNGISVVYKYWACTGGSCYTEDGPVSRPGNDTRTVSGSITVSSNDSVRVYFKKQSSGYTNSWNFTGTTGSTSDVVNFSAL